MSYRRKKDSARGNRGSGSDASQRPIGNNRDQVVRNPLDIERENDDFMQGKVMPMLETLVLRNSLADNNTSQAELLRDDPNSFIPTSIGQFFLVLVRLCNFMLSRLKEAASNETMHNIDQKMSEEPREIVLFTGKDQRN
ncbi:3094_t:CDS:2 [Funneliformis caledonium]|uniref:3094_t:CDS:1 n=1 Tax=Funneliformis caledonium TaxID=1117310 RepID=A0A9N9BPB2_9GLOM|nr:3094_t:CDS:2 [Funneliformis caledonium]